MDEALFFCLIDMYLVFVCSNHGDGDLSLRHGGTHQYFTGSPRLLEIAAYLVGEHQLWKDLGLLRIRALICCNIAPRPTEILRICQACSKDLNQQTNSEIDVFVNPISCAYRYAYIYIYINIMTM